MRITVNIPNEVGEASKAFADDEGLSVSALYARAVEEYLEAERRRRAFERIEGWIGSAEVRPDALEELEREREASERTPG